MLVSRLLAIAGNPGRYISMENGLMVLREPKSKIRVKLEDFDIS
jgi:hypothetical protein